MNRSAPLAWPHRETWQLRRKLIILGSKKLIISLYLSIYVSNTLLFGLDEREWQVVVVDGWWLSPTRCTKAHQVPNQKTQLTHLSHIYLISLSVVFPPSPGINHKGFSGGGHDFSRAVGPQLVGRFSPPSEGETSAPATLAGRLLQGFLPHPQRPSPEEGGSFPSKDISLHAMRCIVYTRLFIL